MVAFRDNQELPLTNRLEEEWIPMIKEGGYTDFQLFDLEEDPGQTTDIASRYPDLAESLRTKLLDLNRVIMEEGTDWHLNQ
jgi:arylsulfatase A